MRKILIMDVKNPIVVIDDFKKLFGMNVTKVVSCDVAMADGELIEGTAIFYKTSKRKYNKYLETRKRYGY